MDKIMTVTLSEDEIDLIVRSLQFKVEATVLEMVVYPAISMDQITEVNDIYCKLIDKLSGTVLAEYKE